MTKQYTITEENESKNETFGYIMELTEEEVRKIKEKINDSRESLSIEQTLYTERDVNLINGHSSNTYLNRLDFYVFEAENTLDNWTTKYEVFNKKKGLKKTKCPKNIEKTDKIYFRKNAGNTSYATPMVIIIGDYEISIAADDSAGAFEQFERTSLCVFKEDKMLLNKRFVTIETILEAIDTVNKLQYEDSTKIAVDERENTIKSLCEAVIYIEPNG